jgi:hypothetical protein
MSEIAMHSTAQSEKAFSRGTALLIVAVGTLAFVAMLVLGAYAPDLRSGRNGGAHALSNAAVGFSGLVRLVEATDRNPVIVRSVDQLKTKQLAIVTPDSGTVDISKIANARSGLPTLWVLPKWDTVKDPSQTGWVRISGLMPDADPGSLFAPGWVLNVSRVRTAREPLRAAVPGVPPAVAFRAPLVLQTISADKLQPVIVDAAGQIVLGKAADAPLYILADPDLLNNHGMADIGQASAALALIDYLNTTGNRGILFDVTSNGLGQSRSPLKLAFDPPFLAATLTMFAAMLLAGWQAAIRFGSPRLQERAIAFGKAALVDNNAALIRKAGREARLGPRYVDVIRKRAVALFKLPASWGPEEVDSRLESLNPRWSFTSAANAVENARSRDELLRAAQSLNRWLEEAQE